MNQRYDYVSVTVPTENPLQNHVSPNGSDLSPMRNPFQNMVSDHAAYTPHGGTPFRNMCHPI